MAATDRALGDLHAQVATELTKALQSGEEGAPAPAAYFGAAIAFLKNNNITASPTENAALADLAKTLADKRKTRRAIDPSVLREAEAEFSYVSKDIGLQ